MSILWLWVVRARAKAEVDAWVRAIARPDPGSIRTEQIVPGNLFVTIGELPPPRRKVEIVQVWQAILDHYRMLPTVDTAEAAVYQLAFMHGNLQGFHNAAIKKIPQGVPLGAKLAAALTAMKDLVDLLGPAVSLCHNAGGDDAAVLKLLRNDFDGHLSRWRAEQKIP